METKSRLLIICVLICEILVSCNKEQNRPTEKDVPAEESITIPIERALASLDKLMSELYGTTKSANQNYSVEVFGGIKTKASDFSPLPDTTLYLVNMEKGYAVLSAQEKIKPDVFCITESGAISSEDIQNAIYRMEQSDFDSELQDIDDIEAGEIIDDDMSDDEIFDIEGFEDIGRETVPSIIAASVINQLYYGYEPEYEIIETKANSYSGQPHSLATLRTKWNQKQPFNNFRKDGAPAGCVAIATAQIIEFNAINYGYTSFKIDNNKKFDWSALSTVYDCSNISEKGDSFAQNEASNFLSYVGLKKNCHIRYKKDGSGGYADGAKRTFKNMGYKSVKKYYGFEKADRGRVIVQLTKGFPMYMDGSRKFKGHAWVLDGIYARKVYSETNKYLRTETLLHINWGWHGQDDGYYMLGVFDTSKRQDIESGIDPGTVSSTTSKYTWNYRTITYSL